MVKSNTNKLEGTSSNGDILSDQIDLLYKSRTREVIKKGGRLLSLDFYRGLVMVLLMLESTRMYDHWLEMSRESGFLDSLTAQFTHIPWRGLHFWDFIQPAFMFIAGTAMAFSLTKQIAQGRSWEEQLTHAVIRSWWLFFWGVLNYAVRGDHLSFELWNVLTQLSFTLLVAFLIFRWKLGYQLFFSVGLLVLTECLYRFTHIPGFDQPFMDQHNFGNYIDMLLMDKINSEGWVAINCLPTSAHTIWGAVAGKWLLECSTIKGKIGNIVILGFAALVAGYTLDILNITPIIKRIATSSFTLVTGGWCLLALAILYHWIDVLRNNRYLSFFTIVGMNSIFIYLFFEILVSRWLGEYVEVIVTGVLLPTGMAHMATLLFAALAIFAIEWYLCYWLYRKKIFFKV